MYTPLLTLTFGFKRFLVFYVFLFTFFFPFFFPFKTLDLHFFGGLIFNVASLIIFSSLFLQKLREATQKIKNKKFLNLRSITSGIFLAIF